MMDLAGGTSKVSSTVTSTKDLWTANFIVKSFVAGGLAGMVAKSAVAPLDRLKILLQAQNVNYKNAGIVSGMSRIIRLEGYFSLFQGNGAQMVRIFPYSAIQFTAFEVYKRVIPSLLNIDGHKSHSIKFLAGSMAGVTAVFFTFPLDLIRTRLAFQTIDEMRYKGIFHAGKTISIEEGGMRGLYRGLVPTLVGMIPYSGFAFLCFELCKQFCITHLSNITCYVVRQHSGSKGAEDSSVLTLRIPAKLLCGGMAGAVAQTVAYPLDVARRRMQMAMLKPETEKFATGTFSTLYLVYKEDGIVKGIFRGMSINYVRAVPMVALSFSTYELMKQAMNIETGVSLGS